MIRLGHILYSNCFPVHALLVDGAPPPGIAVVPGVPTELNRQLAEGAIDVAPCSSIEYALHAAEYQVLPGLAIGSAGPVQSILLETTLPAEGLDGCEVLVPTASATSVVLLRILLERRLGVTPRLRWFDQSVETEPLAGGAPAALWIGDVALRRQPPSGRLVYDLGEEWTRWTALPFAYAIWQARAGVPRADLARLHALLLESRARFFAGVETFAARHATAFGIEPARLARYWRSLRYSLDDEMMRGLLHFYRLAHEIGAAPAVESVRRVGVASG
jgi:chorismate dehydratase